MIKSQLGDSLKVMNEVIRTYIFECECLNSNFGFKFTSKRKLKVFVPLTADNFEYMYLKFEFLGCTIKCRPSETINNSFMIEINITDNPGLPEFARFIWNYCNEKRKEREII